MTSDAMRVWREASWAFDQSLTDAGGNQAAAAVIERAIAEAVEKERARIVEWLRKDTPEPSSLTDAGQRIVAACALDFADAIERGDHKERADG